MYVYVQYVSKFLHERELQNVIRMITSSEAMHIVYIHVHCNYIAYGSIQLCLSHLQVD